MKKSILTTYLITGSIVLVIIISTLVIAPLISRIKAASLKWAEEGVAADNLYIDWLALQSSQKLLSQIDRERLDRPLIKSEQSLDFILLIEDLVRKSGLQHELKVATPLSSEQNTVGRKLTLPFQLTLWGNFPSLMTFLSYFDNLPYYLQIQSMQIKRVGERRTSQQLTDLTSGDVEAIINLELYTK